MWIGLVELLQRPGAGVLLDRNLAYSNVVGRAKTAEEFTESVKKAAAGMGFDVVSIEDVETLAARRSVYAIAPEVLALADESGVDGAPRFGTFYTWRSE